MAGLGKKRGALTDAKSKSSKRLKTGAAASLPLGHTGRSGSRSSEKAPAVMIGAFTDDEGEGTRAPPSKSPVRHAAGSPLRSDSLTPIEDAAVVTGARIVGPARAASSRGIGDLQGPSTVPGIGMKS